MLPRMQSRFDTPLARAAGWMAGWLTLMVVIAVAGREAARELSVFQIMLLRSTLGFAMLWPLVHAAGGLGAVRTERLPQHALRNAIHYAAQYGWFVALSLIPLAQVVSIEFTMPIWSALLAIFFLGSRVRRLRGAGEIAHPHGSSSRDQLLDADHAKRHRASPRALGLAMAFCSRLGLGRGGGILRNLLPLLLRKGHAACGCHRCRTDGLPACAVDCACWLTGVLGALGSVHAAWHWPDPGWKCAEPGAPTCG
jgi:uncharacterized membrane protein